MKVELTIFKVKAGKSERVDEWIEYMQNNMSDVLRTLKDEKTHFETIFRKQLDDAEYIYWYSVQNPNVENTGKDIYIDKKHLAFMEECIDVTFRPDDLNASIIMMPEKVRSVMN